MSTITRIIMEAERTSALEAWRRRGAGPCVCILRTHIIRTHVIHQMYVLRRRGVVQEARGTSEHQRSLT
jgi:hypothetical protein